MSQSDRELASTFIPADIEAPLYEKWMKAGYFTADAKSEKPPYTIVIPPPNVTGVLHIGHALDHTLQDVLIRMKRMKGFEALWSVNEVMIHREACVDHVLQRVHFFFGGFEGELEHPDALVIHLVFELGQLHEVEFIRHEQWHRGIHCTGGYCQRVNFSRETGRSVES